MVHSPVGTGNTYNIGFNVQQSGTHQQQGQNPTQPNNRLNSIQPCKRSVFSRLSKYTFNTGMVGTFAGAGYLAAAGNLSLTVLGTTLAPLALGALVGGAGALIGGLTHSMRSCTSSSTFNRQFKGADEFLNHLKNGDIKFNQTTKLFEYNPTKNAENAIKDKFLYNKHGQLAFGRRIGATTVDSLLNKVNRNLSSVDLNNLDPAKAAVNAHTSLGDTLKSDMKYSQIRKALSGAALYTIGGGAAGAAFGAGFGGIAGGVAGGALGGVHMIASTVAYKHKKHDMSNQLMRIVKADYPQVQFGVHPSSSLGHIDSGLGGDFVTPIHLGNAFNGGGGGSGGSSFFDGFSFDVSL